MEAKEKAIELMKKFEDLSLHFEDEIFYTAQHNSLLCVDEIQKVRQRVTISESGKGLEIIPDKYWVSVKSELQNLNYGI